jgi:threonine dehydrogenase-like Zn-dependent dehydrogenase
MKKDPKKIGLAIIGAGRVGLIRAELAARHPTVGWIGIAEINPERGEIVRENAAVISSPPITGNYWHARKSMPSSSPPTNTCTSTRSSWLLNVNCRC